MVLQHLELQDFFVVDLLLRTYLQRIVDKQQFALLDDSDSIVHLLNGVDELQSLSLRRLGGRAFK